MAAVVDGLRELVRANRLAEPDLRRQFNRGYRRVAEPTRATAEMNAVSRIRNIPRSPAWGRMRIGATNRMVYVAPRERGLKKGPAKRPNLADLLMDRAMQPALDTHEHQIVREFERFLADMARHWER